MTVELKLFSDGAELALYRFATLSGWRWLHSHFLLSARMKVCNFSNPVPLNEYHASIDSILQATGIVFDAAIYGFAICVPLILLIFKK
jgi:hypothetical protein